MRTVSAGILLSDNKILLGKRRTDLKFYPGVWDIIGGHVEDNETPEQTLFRELREELSVTPIRFTSIRVLRFSDTSTGEVYDYHIYLVTEWMGTPRNTADYEHSEVSWFGISDALRLNLAHPVYLEIFKSLDVKPTGLNQAALRRINSEASDLTVAKVERNNAFGLVIFDCDGVLVDTEFIESQAVFAVLKELGPEIEPDEVARRVTGLSDRDLWAIFEGELGRPLPGDIVERHTTLLIEKYRRGLSPIPGVIEVVGQLAAAGVPICVASNGTLDKMEVTLGVTGLSRYFGANVFSATQVANGKPAPDLFLMAAETMGLPPSRCAVIEDSRPGVKAALAADMAVFGYCPTGDIWGLNELGVQTFRNMRELPGLLRQACYE